MPALRFYLHHHAHEERASKTVVRRENLEYLGIVNADRTDAQPLRVPAGQLGLHVLQQRYLRTANVAAYSYQL